MRVLTASIATGYMLGFFKSRKEARLQTLNPSHASLEPCVAHFGAIGAGVLGA
jgi:hypothetical protein